MKKIIVLLILALLAVSDAQAAELYSTITACRYKMRTLLGMDTASNNSLPDTVANGFIRDAVVHCAPGIRARQFTKKTVTTASVGQYAVDSIIRLISVSTKFADTLKPMKFMPRQFWPEQEHQYTGGGQKSFLARPSFYDFDDDSVYVYPLPTAIAGRTDSLFITGVVRFASIDTLTSLTRYPEKLRLTFVWYATYLYALAKRDARVTMYYQNYEMQKTEVEKLYRRETDSDNTSTR